MKYLVTGGAGFIGSHIVKQLLAKNHEVAVIDNLSTGSLNNLDLSNKHLHFLEVDISEIEAKNAIFKDVHGLFHLAAQVSVPKSIENPIYDAQVNAQGTLCLLEACKQNNIPKMVFSSSCALYGNTSQLPIPEDCPQAPLSPYALHKWQSEEYGQLYAKQHNIQFIALRYFNVYGPGQLDTSPYSGVISRFIKAAVENTPITLFGDGLQSRDFIFVDDVASINLHAMMTHEAPFDVFNVCTGKSTSLIDLIKTIEDITSNRMIIHHEQARSGDIRHSLGNPNKFNSHDVEAKVSLADGLAQTIIWYQNKESSLIK